MSDRPDSARMGASSLPFYACRQAIAQHGFWRVGRADVLRLHFCFWPDGVCLGIQPGQQPFWNYEPANGSFTQLGTEGSTLFNDIAASPNGDLYGIVNSASLLTLNTNNGAVLTSVSFSVGGIESLAIAPNGTLYGASQSALYTINPANGVATLVGNFNNSAIGNSGQNIRFAADGNLYDTDGGVNATNTDLFQISTVNGGATLVGVVTNFPGLCLENAGSQMYGVGIQLGSASSLFQDLVGIDLSSLKPGGTNSNGSPLDISYNLLTANFLNNYNFSSADLFIVPAPEPGTVSLSIMGGMIFLMLSRSRMRC